MASYIKTIPSEAKTCWINKKQEFFCMSVVSLISCPFGVLPVASANKGTQIDKETRNFSLISNLLSAVWLAPTLYFARPVFATIPSNVVTALIVSTLFDVRNDLKLLRMLCSAHTCDAVIAVSALLCALSLPNLCSGFLAACASALLSVVVRTQWPRCEAVVRAGENCFVEESRYEGECSDSPVRILRLYAPLIFINCETIRGRIRQQAASVKGLMEVGTGSRTPSLRSQALMGPRESLVGRTSNNLLVIGQDSELQQVPNDSATLRFIILDCSGVACVDHEAVAMLSQVYSELSDDNITLLFAGVNASIRDFLEAIKFYSNVPRGHFFPTLQEARSAVRSMNFPFHMSVSMNGYRDVVTLSTAPSNQDISRHTPEAV